MSTWVKIPGTALPPSLIAFFLSLIFQNLAVFWYHFQLSPPALFLPGFRENQDLGGGQVKSKALHSPPHPPNTTSLVTLRPVNSGLQKNSSHMEPTPMGCPSS